MSSRKYLPVLKKFPAEYIYEPWKAPRSIQERAGCIVGKDYPRPIVEHEVVRKKNIQRMKAAYAKRSPEDKTTTKGNYLEQKYEYYSHIQTSHLSRSSGSLPDLYTICVQE